MKIRPEEITSVLERELEKYEAALDVEQVGTVLEVGDGSPAPCRARCSTSATTCTASP